MIASSKHWLKQFFALIGATLVCANAGAELPPFHIWGDLGYDFRYNWRNEAEAAMENAVGLRVNIATYLWQPWLAQVRGGIGLRFSKVQGDAEDRTSHLASLDGGLKLFSSSRFPFDAFIDYRDDVIDANLFDNNTTVLRYGFQQRYTSPNSATGLYLRYEHSERSTEQSNQATAETDLNDFAEFGASRVFFKKLDLRLRARYNDNQRDHSDNRDTRFFSLLQHRYDFGPTVSHNGQLVYRQDNTSRTNNDLLNQRWELNEFFFWRPRNEKPLLVSGTLRFLDITNSTSAGETQGQSLNGSIGASYQLSPNWQLSANANANLNERDGQDTLTTLSERADLRYTSDSRRWGSYDYGWFGSLSGVFEQSDGDLISGTDNLVSGTLSGGYDFGRQFAIGENMPLTLRFGQAISATEDTQGRSTQRLDNNLNLNWNWNTDKANTLALLTLNDSRTFGGGGRFGNEARESQFITFQLSRDQRLTRFSSWHGIITFQASRQVAAEDDLILPGEDPDFVDDDGFKPTARIELDYQHQRLFKVPRLQFRSTLRLYSDSYLPLLDDPSNPDANKGQVWENRLDYQIGRLDLSLLTRINNARGNRNALVFFQVRRLFDGIY